MIYRRFSVLHARLLLRKQTELLRLEREMQELDNGEMHGKHYEEPAEEPEDEPEARNTLLRRIEDKLSEYLSEIRNCTMTSADHVHSLDEMISSMEPLRKVPKPTCRSVKEYLTLGPPVYIDPSYVMDPRWSKYERAVDLVLLDLDKTSWPDGDIDCLWTSQGGPSHPSHLHQGISNELLEMLKRAWCDWSFLGGILFWVFNLTAALGYLLISISSEGNDISSPPDDILSKM